MAKMSVALACKFYNSTYFIVLADSGSVDATNTVIVSGLAMSAAAFSGLFLLADYFAGGAFITPIRRTFDRSAISKLFFSFYFSYNGRLLNAKRTFFTCFPQCLGSFSPARRLTDFQP